MSEEERWSCGIRIERKSKNVFMADLYTLRTKTIYYSLPGEHVLLLLRCKNITEHF